MKTSERETAREAWADAGRTRMLEELGRAARLVRGGASGERLSELLGDLLARARADEAVRAATGYANSASPVTSVLAMRVLANENGGIPAREFRLIPFGNVGVDRPIAGGEFEFTRSHAEAARRWFETIGRKLAIDYEHQSIDRLNTRPDGLRPAAGWIGGLEVRDDGLWAVDVEWTERAQTLLKSGEYRYFSPVIFWADAERRELASLGPVALTNDPAMHGVAALAAGREHEAGDGLTGFDEDGDESELAALQEEISVLRRAIARQEADTFVERGLRLGKIVEATSMDWREDYLRDPEDAAARLSRAPVILPPGRVLARTGETDRRTRRVDERLARLGVEAADLEAYEQAMAGGRVRRLNTV